MNTEFLFRSMENFASVLPHLVAGLTDEEVRWKPPSMNWSILEIVGHLLDEEVNDFRQRIQMTLDQSLDPWPSINPELTAIDQRFNDQDLEAALNRFVVERHRSLSWLRSLESPDWNTVYHHPHLGDIHAGDLLASWAAHDQLHSRQIAKRKYELLVRAAAPFSANYAGEWGP